MQDKHRLCQDGMFFRHSVQKKDGTHPEPCAEMDETRKNKRAPVRKQLHLKADCEFSRLQEISRLSRSVFNCLAKQKQGIHVVAPKKHALTFQH